MFRNLILLNLECKTTTVHQVNILCLISSRFLFNRLNNYECKLEARCTTRQQRHLIRTNLEEIHITRKTIHTHTPARLAVTKRHTKRCEVSGRNKFHRSILLDHGLKRIHEYQKIIKAIPLSYY